VITRAAAVLALVAALGACSTDNPTASSSGSGSGSGSGSVATDDKPADVSYVVGAKDYAFVLPAGLTVKTGQRVRLELDNSGTVKHELELFDPSGTAIGEVPPVAPGSKGHATFEIKTAGTYQLVCGVDDHKERGMTATITVG
jgi:uncharacterized cupredoxin-like copper-binding protein